MRNVLVLMTAMPPTLGHKFLIDFAITFAGGGYTEVLLNTRDCEPIPGELRYAALFDAYIDRKNFRIGWCNEDVPQNPSEHPDFWNYWKKLIERYVRHKPDVIIASETYGLKLAETLGCEFVPCDIARQVRPISGTKVRNNPIDHFNEILPEMRHYFTKTVTIFGAESCGKTTMAKELSAWMKGRFVPEWAREYLETCGTEVTEAKMKNITYGQYAMQKAAREMNDKPFIFQDTDLLSTIGYYRIMGIPPLNRTVDLFNRSRSDLYIVMNDQIPFEPDPLRYGGDKRESNTQFWIDLLEEFGCRYYVVQNTDRHEQLYEVGRVVSKLYLETSEPVAQFVRT